MGLINSDDIPRLSDCEYDLIREHGETLRAVGKDVTATGSGVATTYRTLYNVYVAPEADQLVTSIDPVLSDSTEFGNTMTGVGTALKDFADEIQPVNERLIDLVGDASDLHLKITKCRLNGQAMHRAMEEQTSSSVMAGVLGLATETGVSAVNMATGKWEHTTKDFASAEYPEGAILVGTDWDGYTDLVGENNRINGEVRRLAPKFIEIQQRCANRVAILCGGRMWNLETGEPDGWELPPEVDEFGNEVKRIGAPPPPSWAEDAEWDRPLAMDVAAAPGELLLETLDFVTTLSGLQPALRAGLEGVGLGDTAFTQGLATWKESGEAWVNLAKTVGAVAGALASVNPITDAGFKAVVGEETAAELNRFGVEWANGIVEDWKRNPAKAVLGVAVAAVPVGGALAGLRAAGMASKIRPVAAVARGAQKLVDLKGAVTGKVLDTLRLPRVADIIGGKADIPLIEAPHRVGVDSGGVRIDTSTGRPGVDRVEVPAVVGRNGNGSPGSADRLGEQIPVTHERPVTHGRPLERPIEQPVRTPNDRIGIDTTQRHPGTDDRPITSPSDRPAARTGDREGQPVTPVTHPVGHVGDRTGTPPTHIDRTGTPPGAGDRTGTPPVHVDRTGTSPGAGDRTGTSTPGDRTGTSTTEGRGRDRESTETQDRHDRAAADRRRQEQTEPVGRHTEREPVSTGHDPRGESQAPSRRDGEARSETPPPYIHASHTGGGGTSRPGTGSPPAHGRSGPDDEYRFGPGNPKLDPDLRPAAKRKDPDVGSADQWKPEYDEVMDRLTPDRNKDVPGRPRPQVSPHTWIHPDPKDPKWGELVDAVGDDPLGNVERWASKVNPYFDKALEYKINCHESSELFADILQGGQPRLAAGNPNRNIRGRWGDEVHKWMGVEPYPANMSEWPHLDRPPSDRFVADAYDSVRLGLEGRPAGTVAIVHVLWSGRGGHVFNAFVDAKGVVKWADAQGTKAQIGGWPPRYNSRPTWLEFNVREPGGDWEGVPLRGGAQHSTAPTAGRADDSSARGASKHPGESDIARRLEGDDNADWSDIGRRLEGDEPDAGPDVERRYDDPDTDTRRRPVSDKGRRPDPDLADRPEHTDGPEHTDRPERSRQSDEDRTPGPTPAHRHDDPDSDIPRRHRGEPTARSRPDAEPHPARSHDPADVRRRPDGDTDPDRVSGDRVNGDRVDGDRVHGEGLERPDRSRRSEPGDAERSTLHDPSRADASADGDRGGDYSEIARRLAGEPPMSRIERRLAGYDDDTHPDTRAANAVDSDHPAASEGYSRIARRLAGHDDHAHLSDIARRLGGYDDDTPDAQAANARDADESQEPRRTTDEGPPVLDPFKIAPPRTAADGPALPTKRLERHYRGEEEGRGGRKLPQPHRVIYLDAVGRELHRLVVHKGLLYGIDGRPFDTSGASSYWSGKGRAMFVTDEFGNIYASTVQVPGRFHHSSFVAGGPVSAAGELEVVNGRLVYVSDKSGHYLPKPMYLEQFINRLKGDGVNFDDVERGSWKK